jgi:cysteine desulfurase family protein (TIGR01976 family)
MARDAPLDRHFDPARCSRTLTTLAPESTADQMSLTQQQIESCRSQFPALARKVNGQDVAYFDGPAGTQVPQRVIDAVSHYLAHTNANHGGLFATSQESDEIVADAHRALAAFLGADDPDAVVFGQNMTSLTFALSRSVAKTWRSGDEIVVTRLDHDANVTPWVLAAQDAGVVVKYVRFREADCTLDLDDFHAQLSPRTRLVAVGCASNATGGINPLGEICRAAHDFGAWVFLDAVHFAPHRLIDVQFLGCEFLACSAYKFFGPHIGVLWGRRDLLEALPAYKVRPAPDSLPWKWMTGTQSHEAIAGARAAVDYLADIGRLVRPDETLDRRAALREAFRAIAAHERELVRQLLAGLAQLEDVKVWGITDLQRLDERLPTVSLTHAKMKPAELAVQLAGRGIFVWHGNYYALQLTEALGLEPDGMLRIGLVHYNTREEVDRLIGALTTVSR